MRVRSNQHPMKKLLLTTSIVALSFCGAFAGDGKSFKEVKTVVAPEPPCRFRDIEFQVDAFYTQISGAPMIAYSTPAPVVDLA